VLTLLAPGGHDFTTAELRLAGSIASVAAAALTRAQIFERERRIAETFQRTFLPHVPEQVGEFELAHQYAAALDEARVGGDFYDVFHTPDGRLALVIGDVSGKGLNAAVHTAMAKYLLRGFAHCSADPGAVLRQVNNALCFYAPENMFITLFFGLLDTSSGLLYYANAGHEPPLLWSRKTGRIRSLASTGRALGFVGGGEFLCEEAAIEPGDILVMYTDGVTEARNGGTLFDVSGVRDAVRSAAGDSAARVAELIETRAREHAGGRLTDDIALLVARRRG
jgi:sigma-B regulation protein RsbU (phosphoserine phosphatase)